MRHAIVLSCTVLSLITPLAFSESIIHSPVLKCKAHFVSKALEKTYDFELKYSLNPESGLLIAERISADADNSRVLKYAQLPSVEPLASQNPTFVGVEFLAKPAPKGHNLLSGIFRQAVVQVDTFAKNADFQLHWSTTFRPFANGAVGFFAVDREIELNLKDQLLAMQVTGRDSYDPEAVRTKSTSYARVDQATSSFDDYKIQTKCQP